MGHKSLLVRAFGLLAALTVLSGIAQPQTITPSSYWKNEIVFPNDPFCARGISRDSVRWIKFTILLDPYDPNVVYFQDSRKYVYHYSFANERLDPFVGMTTQQFNSVTLFEEGQQAILGTVILPSSDSLASETPVNEYGIQFVRQDAYTPEEVRDLFHLVKSRIEAPSDVEAFYFPTYEQQDVAQANRDWFESEGVPLGSTARWTDDNVCYSQGWALGRLKFFAADEISLAYRTGLLGPDDILLTDGIPAELPYLAGIVSLVPSTPNSHVAILTETYNVPFVYLALADDVNRARELAGHQIILCAYEDEYGSCDVRLLDTEEMLDDLAVAEILLLKAPEALNISPMAHSGTYGLPVDGIQPSEIVHVGGKASNFGLLRDVLPDNSPKAVALTFDLWNAFLDQPLASVRRIDLAPGEHIVFWADGGQGQGLTHAGFRLSRAGESVALYDVDGATLIDRVTFGPQGTDVSYGRSVDGGDLWQQFATPTPGLANSTDAAVPGSGLVINEFMADNETAVEDPNRPGEHPDWIELYNASDRTIALNGMYLTDDVNDPTQWQIPIATREPTLREEIARYVAKYDSYPPQDMQQLSIDMASVRSLFTTPTITAFSLELREAVIAVLTDAAYGFNPEAKLRFRSSTNVEDSDDFVGAGLYSSHSGCLADDLDGDTSDVCRCDPNDNGPRSVFAAIRRVFASFYSDNAFLERLRHNVDETVVGMAILVHHSFPDEIELANGVATVEVRGDTVNTILTLVSQLGAVSVTNPEGQAIPEEVIVTILPSGSVVPPKLKRASSLVPLGGTVMTWRDDYSQLADMLMAVSDAFGQTTGKTSYMLDLEYKKVAPGGEVLPAGGLVVRQVRQVPEPNHTRSVTPFLINQPTRLEVYPGEFELFGATDVFADHRLKSQWTLQTRNMSLTAANLSEALYGQVHIESLAEDQIRTITGPMALLPSATHAYEDDLVSDTWRWFDLANPRTYRLKTADVPTAVGPLDNPIVALTDLGAYAFNLPYRCLMLTVQYDKPVTSWYQHLWPGDPPSGLETTTEDTVYLWSPPEPSPDDVFNERTFSSGKISVYTSFYYPPPPSGFPNWSAHTAPLIRWNQTVIEGLTTSPIVLEGYYSQTYRPEHHNLVENLLFEPQLEPGISHDQLRQLSDLNIRFIHVILDNQGNNAQSSIATYGFD